MQWTLLRLFIKSGSDNPLLCHYLTPLPRVNRRARPRLVAINQGYRYLGEMEETGSDNETVVKPPGLSSPCTMKGGEGLLTTFGVGFTPHI